TLLCANAYRYGADGLQIAFDQLRELCTAAGDQRSQAIGTCGLLMARQLAGLGHEQESSRLMSELTQLLDSVGDPTLTVALSVPLMSINLETVRFSMALVMAQRVIDVAAGDLTKGRMLTVSPLTTAIAYRGLSRCLTGLPGWKDDFARALEAADAIALRETAEILSAAEQFGDNLVLDMARTARGIIVVHQDGAERDAGAELLAQLMGSGIHHFSNNLRVIEVHLAREKARMGDLDGSIELARKV